MGLLGDDDVDIVYRDVAGAIDRDAIDTGDLVAALRTADHLTDPRRAAQGG
jgi:hypothetical protein